MIYLCSASESRALLLKKFGVEFIQKTLHFDEEQIETQSAREFVYLASKGKMQAAVDTFGLEKPLLCADSVIAAEDGTILRKAKDREDARRILEMQSGSKISIVSCVHFRRKELLFICVIKKFLVRIFIWSLCVMASVTSIA
jgi:septum formation protein